MGGDYYSSSSVSSTPLKRGTRFLCRCGVESPLVTSWTDENPGRRFYGCGRYFVRRKCNFFKWFDPEVPERQKKIIRALLKKNDELKNKERRLAIVIVVLVVMLLISMFIICVKLF